MAKLARSGARRCAHRGEDIRCRVLKERSYDFTRRYQRTSIIVIGPGGTATGISVNACSVARKAMLIEARCTLLFISRVGVCTGVQRSCWKDFRIHRLVVREVLRPRYDWLLAFQPTSTSRTAEAIREILRLADAVRDAYSSQITSVNGRRRVIEVTDALATKVMLATLACVPAYDTYVVAGLGRRAYRTRV